MKKIVSLFLAMTMALSLAACGSKTGEPHYGSHAWPSMCSAVLTMVEDERVDPLLEVLHNMDKQTEQLGLRAFVWNIEKTI